MLHCEHANFCSVFFTDDGISIPCEYTSYVAPLSSSKLWNEARSCRSADKPVEVRSLLAVSLLSVTVHHMLMGC